MSVKRPFLSSIWFQPRSLFIMAMLLITVFQAIVTALVKNILGIEYFDLNVFRNLHLDAIDTGYFVKENIVPVALIFLLTSLPFFKRLVTNTQEKHDKTYLFFAFVCIQLLTALYSYISRPQEYQPEGIFFAILAAALIGGWRVGFGIAAITYALVVARNIYTGYWVSPDISLVQTFLHRDALPLIWQGVFMGLAAQLLGAKKYIPFIALILGFTVELVGRFLVASAIPNVWEWASHILVISAVSGSSLLLLALFVRNVQASHMHEQAQKAELAITQAELKALRAQINPHFIFNSLNTIRYFVRTQPDKARDLLLSLSELFQRSLKSGEVIPLKEEIDYVEAYLALEKARLDERLSVQWVIPDERVYELLVPTLILQPVVENAVIHGIGQKTEGGMLTITIETWDEDLVMQVRDNGTGFRAKGWRERKQQNQEREGQSIGLSNIDNRLSLLYGESYRLKIESEEGIGTRVQIKLPIQKHRPLNVTETTASLTEALNYPPKALEGEL